MNSIDLQGGAANAHQSFKILLGKNNLDISLNWNTMSEYWSMDVIKDGETVIYGMILNPNCEISRPYNAGVGRFFFTGTQPTLDNLGQDNFLTWVDDD